MNEPKPLLKVAVIASSVLLLNAFVAYRAGFFDSFIGPSARPACSGNNSNDDSEKTLTEMPGSKADVNLINSFTSGTPSDSETINTQAPTMMSGAKSSYFPPLRYIRP